MNKFKVIKAYEEHNDLDIIEYVECFYHNKNKLPLHLLVEKLTDIYKLNYNNLIIVDEFDILPCAKDQIRNYKPDYVKIFDCSEGLLLDVNDFKEGESVVYLLKSDKDEYKIGCSKNFKSRFASYRTHNPSELQVMLVYPVYNMRPREMEKMLHQAYSCKNIRAEWFAGEIKHWDVWMICCLYSLYKSKHNHKIGVSEVNSVLAEIGVSHRLT